MNATLWPEHEGARRRGLPVVKACYPRLVSKLAGVPPIMVLTPHKIHNVGKSYPAVEETSHAVEESFHGFYFFLSPKFLRAVRQPVACCGRRLDVGSCSKAMGKRGGSSRWLARQTMTQEMDNRCYVKNITSYVKKITSYVKNFT